ncbi:MAG: flagellar biosynthetic protein FliO [Polyangiaceae bacterium]
MKRAVAAMFLTLLGVASLTAPARADDAVAAPLTPPTQAAPAPAGIPLALKPSRPLTLAEAPASSGGAVAKGLGALVVVGAAAYALRFRKRRPTQARESEKMRVLRRTSLGVKSELVLIEIDGQELLLGVTAQNIQLLAALGAPTADGIEEADEDAERVEQARERARAAAAAQARAEEEARPEPRREAQRAPSRPAREEREPVDQSARLAALLRATGASESEPPSAPRRTTRSAPAREEALEGQVRSLAKWSQRR